MEKKRISMKREEKMEKKIYEKGKKIPEEIRK